MSAFLKALPAIITASEIAELLRTDVETIGDMFEDGTLKGFRVGKEWRAKKEDIERFIDGDEITTNAVDTIKIGEHVKTTMSKLFQSKILPEAELNRLMSKEYCKKMFGLSFALLKQLPADYSAGGDLSPYMNDEKGYARYWKTIFNGKYLVTSQWYERHRKKFDIWLKQYI